MRLLINNKPINENAKKISLGINSIRSSDQSQYTDLKPQNINLNIIYEDEDLLVINKPIGMVVHPGAGNPMGP